MGKRKPHKIGIREERLENLDTTKFEVAIWLLARKKVIDRTQRSQPAPPAREAEQVSDSSVDNSSDSDNADAQEAA